MFVFFASHIHLPGERETSFCIPYVSGGPWFLQPSGSVLFVFVREGDGYVEMWAKIRRQNFFKPVKWCHNSGHQVSGLVIKFVIEWSAKWCAGEMIARCVTTVFACAAWFYECLYGAFFPCSASNKLTVVVI